MCRSSEKVQAKKKKKLGKTNKSKSVFFREIAFLAVSNFFPAQKLIFWLFLKSQKMDFGQKNFFVRLIYLISLHEFFFMVCTFFNFLAHCYVKERHNYSKKNNFEISDYIRYLAIAHFFIRIHIVIIASNF